MSLQWKEDQQFFTKVWRWLLAGFSLFWFSVGCVIALIMEAF